MGSTLVVLKEPLRNQFEKLKAEETNGESYPPANVEFSCPSFSALNCLITSVF
jgi:hypothetical protein